MTYMFQQSSIDSMTTSEQKLNRPECADKPIIKILLYTDAPNGITNGEEQFGLGPMIRHLFAHKPAFADVYVEWLSRFSSETGTAEKKLDSLLTDSSRGYDEVWFFGTFQATRKKFISDVIRGGPESELGKTEVEVLREWMSVGSKPHMKGGGVLMTGDHNQTLIEGTLPADENPLCPECGRRAKFFGLGRALGRCVPRAGRLRKWEGKPTNDPKDSFNTQVPNAGFDIESQILQLDANPQQLLLLSFNAKGKPAVTGLPHPIFFYRAGRRIQFFPDHVHEGAIVLPNEKEFEILEEWPRSSFVQPRPRVVARGIDKRSCSLLDLVAAYNGDCAAVGRVVADSTWHHYIGVNLTSFPQPSTPNTPADQIGQFYGNLAIWLAPRRKRFEMARAMFKWLANHPVMMEEIGGDPVNIGRAAYATLTQVASPCEISEVLDATVPDYFRERYEAIYFPESELVLSPFPPKGLLLGSIVNSLHQAHIKAANSTETFEGRSDEELIAIGFKAALELHAKHIGPIASEAKRLAYSEDLPDSNNQKKER
jgi:hypothetical protein